MSGLNVSMVSWVGTDGSAGILSSLASSFGGNNDERIKAIMTAICAPRGALCKYNYSQSAHFGQPGLDTLLIGRFGS
ncbi:MAG: hypothetical protein O9293_12405 [Porphyrobacter sp.]|nr:hypothetical protein [Porphyrobacter sp.]